MIEHFSLTPSIPTLLLISPLPQLNSGAKLQILQISGPECLYQWFFWLEMPFLFHEFPNLFSLFIASLRFYLKKCFLWKSFRLKTNQVFPHRCSYAYTRTGLFVFVFFLSHWCVLVSHQIKSMAYDRMHYLSPTSCLALRRQSISVEC